MCLSKVYKINYGQQILLFTVFPIVLWPLSMHDEDDDDCSFF